MIFIDKISDNSFSKKKVYHRFFFFAAPNYANKMSPIDVCEWITL